MACYSPLHGFKKPGGGISFNRNEGYVDRPVIVSCGKCVGCRIERSRQWATRCVHEAQFHDANSFVTLTYDRENLPGDLSIHVRDWQLFAKRLRKRLGRFRFFHCGEYGDENFRPHYHALLFGLDFMSDRVLFREDTESRKTYVSELLTDVWGKGFTTVADLTWNSAAYVARYVVKKANGDVRGETKSEKYRRFNPQTGEEWYVTPPYTTMSRRPGIGADWFDAFRDDVYPDDFVIHDGRKFRPPSYYDRRLPEAELELLKRSRKRRAVQHLAEQDSDRLRVRERIEERRLGRLVRSV